MDSKSIMEIHHIFSNLKYITVTSSISRLDLSETRLEGIKLCSNEIEIVGLPKSLVSLDLQIWNYYDDIFEDYYFRGDYLSAGKLVITHELPKLRKLEITYFDTIVLPEFPQLKELCLQYTKMSSLPICNPKIIFLDQ